MSKYISRKGRLVPVEDENGAGILEELDPAKLLTSLARIDAELASLDSEAKKAGRGVVPGKLDTMRFRMTILRHRSSLLFKCLAKSLPDRSYLEHGGGVNVNGSADSIPDHILVSAMTGELTEEQLRQVGMLMKVDPVGGEQ